jgi:hypothetical protein
MTVETPSTGAITLGWTSATPVPIGGKIIITLPFNYFSAADLSKINTFPHQRWPGATVTSPATTSCVFAPGTAAACCTLTCTIKLGSGNLAAGAQLMTLVIGAVATSSAPPNVITTTSGGLTLDSALAVGGITPTITGGGQMIAKRDVAFVNQAADAKVGTLSTTGAITLGWTSATPVPIGGKIIITLPFTYFRTADPSIDNAFGSTSTKANCAFAPGAAAAGSTLTWTTIISILAAGVQVMNLIQGAVTAGIAQVAGTFNVFSTTSSRLTLDTALAIPGATVAITGGGQLTSLVPFQFNNFGTDGQIGALTTSSSLPSAA